MHFMDLELRLLLLLRLPAADGPDQHADDEERTRRQQHHAVALVPAAFADQRQYLDAEQRAGAEQLAYHGHRDQDDAVAEPVAEAVQEAHADAVLHGERLGAAQHDAVGDDQPDEYRQLAAGVESEGPQRLVHHDHQRGDDGHLHDDADIGRDTVADEAHARIG